MDIAEGDYIPDLAMGDDPISKVFFISDGLLQMIKDKYKLKFARYVADVAASKPDDEPVPEWFVDNLLRDYLNQKFLLNPPLPIKQTTDDNTIDGIEIEEDLENWGYRDDKIGPIKEQTEVEVVDDNIGGLDKAGGYVENRKFTPKECRILKLLSNRFEFEELQKLVNVDSHALSGEFQNKWGDTMKLIGEPLGSMERWGKSLRWAAWIIDNYDYVSSTGDGFCDIEKPLIRYPSMYEVQGDDSGWERIYRTGGIEIPAFDADDAYERAENHWFDYEPEMETSDYGDYESDDDLELGEPYHMKTLKEQQLPFNPDNKNIERDHPKGEPDWSIRRGRQHYAMNVEDTKSEPVTALNNYLVKNSPFNFLGFDYYLTAVPGRMPNQANVDIFVPMLDTGPNADALWTTRFTPVVNLDIHDDKGPYLESTTEFLHQIRADEKWPEYYMYEEVRDNFPDQVKAYEERESDYINYPGAVYNHSWRKREDLLEEELVELGKLFGIEGILINRQPFYPWKRKKDSYGNEDIRPGETVPRGYPRPIKEQEDKESEFKQVVQDVVYSVYPHIIENLGVPDEGIPGVELWVDIYARLSGIENMRGEASESTKAEYVDEDNMIYIYYPNMENVEDIIRSLLHEYTHSLQDPDRTAQRAGGYDYDPNEIEATEAESNWKDYLVYVREDLFEQSTGEQPIFTKRFLTILNYFMTMNNVNRADKFIGAFRREFPQVQQWLPGWLWMVLLHNKNVSGLSTIQDTVTGIKPEDWEFPPIWEYEVSYWDEGYESEDEEECDIDTGRGEMTYEECDDCLRAIKERRDEEGYLEEVECDEYEHPDYDDEDCRCIEYERRRYTVWYNQTRYVDFLTLQPLEKTNDSGYTYGYDTWDEVDMDIDYKQTIITKDEEDTEYDQQYFEEYGLEDEGDIIGVDADEYDSSYVKKYMRNLVGGVLGTKDPQENLTEQFDMLSPKEMKKRDLTTQIFNLLNSNFTILPFDDGELDYEGKPMGLYSHQHESFIPLDAIFSPVMDMVEGGIDQEDIEIFVRVITDWINQTMLTKRDDINEDVHIQDKDSEYTKEEYIDFIDFVNDKLDIENEVDIYIEDEPTSDYTTGNYNPKDKKVKVRDSGRKLVDILRTIAHELVHHKQNELGKINKPVPEIGGEIEDEANVDAGRLVKYYGKMKPEIYTEQIDPEQFQLAILKQTPSTQDDEEFQEKLDNPPFKNRKEGNLFRKWVNKQFPEIAVELKLDPEGPHDNETIKKAWLYVTEDDESLGLKWVVLTPNQKKDIENEFKPIKIDTDSKTTGTQKEKALLKAIIWAEGTLTSNPYTVIYGGEMVPELTSLTADEWLEIARTKKLPVRFGGGKVPYKTDKYRSTATGAFQIMPNTLRGVMRGGILSGDDVMNPANQDKAALYLVGPGQAKLDMSDFGNSLTVYQMNQLSKVWASIAHSKGKGGKGNKEGSYYGQGGKSQKAFNEKYQEYLGIEVKDVERKEIIKNELEIEDIIADENLCSNLQFVKIPGSNNDWRSGQPSLGELKYIIQTFNIKNVIRMNGDSESDSSQKCGKGNVSTAEEKALVEELGANFYGGKRGFLNAHSGFVKEKGYTKSMENALPILDEGNTLIHCRNGADRTGYIVAEWLQQNQNWDKDKLWEYTTQYNGWGGKNGRICTPRNNIGYIKYMEGFYPLKEWCKGSGNPTDRSSCYSCKNIDDIYRKMG